MGIRVKHSPSAAAIGESAYTIGRGEKRRWAVDVGQKQQALDLQGASIGLQAKARSEALAQQEKESERLHGLREDELELRKKRLADEPARQLERGLQQQELLQKNVEWQYDEGQKREMAKITTGVAWLREQVASGKWTAEQAEQAEQQLWSKYHAVIPLPVYDDTPSPQQMWDSGLVTDPITGAQYRQKGNGDFDPVGISFTEYSKLYADISEQYKKMDGEGNPIPPDPKVVHEAVIQAYKQFSQIQGHAAQTQKEQGRLVQSAQGKLAGGQEQETRADGTQKGPGFLGELKLPNGGVATEYSVGVQLESKGGQETEIPSLVPTLTPSELSTMVNDIIPNRKPVPEAIVQKAVDHANKRVKQGKSPFSEGPAIEALPKLFATLVKGQPKIGRTKLQVAGKNIKTADKVYGEKAYDKMLLEAVSRSRQNGIPPEVVKAELDKWWDEQHDKERGQMFQKFGNRMSFKGQASDSKPSERKVAPEVPFPLDEFEAGTVKKFKSGKIVWTAIRKRYGQETADELKYIAASGNEQAIANALRRLGII